MSVNFGGSLALEKDSTAREFCAQIAPDKGEDLMVHDS